MEKATIVRNVGGVKGHATDGYEVQFLDGTRRVFNTDYIADD